MSDKEKLNEGRIRKFIDNIFYKILNGINDRLVRAIESDPEMKEKIDRFEEAKEELSNALQDLAENPEKYAPPEEFADEYAKKKGIGTYSDRDPVDDEDDDEDVPPFMKKMMD